MNKSIAVLPDRLHPIELGSAGGTLVIVDMQAEFLGVCKTAFLTHVLAQIALARSRGWSIVLLEVKPWRIGESIPEIQEALRGARFKRVSKQQTSGSREVLDCCFEEGFNSEFFRVVGVYTDACVAATAEGLAVENEHCQVRVMKEACASDLDEVEAWAEFPVHERLVVSSVEVDGRQ